MLSIEMLFEQDGVALADVACRHQRGVGKTSTDQGGFSMVFVRRGHFVRSADGVAQLLDPTLAYGAAPGQEERYDHAHAHGDDCTRIELSETLLMELRGGEPTLPNRAVPIPPAIDLHHRLLLASARRRDDPQELVERAISLVAATFAVDDPKRSVAGRPVTEAARRRLADDARELLLADPGRSLPALARDLGSSPHHLSRVFAAVTGSTVSQFRRRLRTRLALERLAGGEDDLARLAADVGFADHSHLVRVFRQQAGSTPSELRRALAASPGGSRR